MGEDTSMYLSVYEKAASVAWGDIFRNFFSRTVFETLIYGYENTIESGFLILCKLCHLFFKDAHLFLLLVAGLTYCFFGKFIYDNTEYVVFATLVLLCENIFMFSFNGIRQLLSVSIALQSYKYIRRRDFAKSIIWILPAYLIHNSSIAALLLIPFELIKEKKETKYFKYVVLFSACLPSIVLALGGIISRFLPRYRYYFTVNYWENSLGGAVILLGIEALLIAYLYHKRFSINDSFRLSCYTVIFIAFEIAGIQVTMFARAAIVFRSFLILFFPSALRIFKGKTRLMVRCLILVALLFLYLSCASSPARVYNVCSTTI